ncbi:acyl-CoA-binding domain-containing protein 4-like [Chenopodium quinoa]|uniref:acyl-CoA-binding domain-containing protein 4-like n=1 Tax=Chenopodium quinoa TaxID=63459 RepID=UPI000B780D03|nr:acyl-CoA-binding domain-containing protein 4-like [Chenopodium quinoa]XP_021751069.1 acyl-CoA-binding domain-containing protein 4-like [Chenopodium quinoa]
MKMFGFTRRRPKLGRMKVHLADSAQGTKSPLRPLKRTSNSNVETTVVASNQEGESDCHCSSAPRDISNCTSGSSESWMVLSISGDKPKPRLNHAATVVGNKMVVVGGESTDGMLDDVQVLSFDQFSWTTASSKIYLSPNTLPLKIPSCKGHSLVSWGKKALLVGGKTNPGSEKVSVWAYDTETECWSLMEAKGDVPVARSGHTVVKSSSVLILFGGEDSKRRKLNDLHMFDLKSMTWLPLQCTGTGPSPRSNHVAALYDDRILYIFGGSSKSKTFNDLYSLDFETMMWSKNKIRGFHPSPRAGCCGVLCGTKWYIIGGGSRKKRHLETLIFDIVKVEWSVATTSPPSSITTNKGFSLVLVEHKERDFLVAFGGSRKEPSNQVEVLILDKSGNSSGRRLAPNKNPGSLPRHNRSSSNEFASQLHGAPSCPVDSLRQNLASIIEEHGSTRRSLSESVHADSTNASGSVSLRKQFHCEEDPTRKPSNSRSSDDENSLSQFLEQRRPPETACPAETSGRFIMEDIPSFSESGNLSVPSCVSEKFPLDNEEIIFPESDEKCGVYSAPSSIYQLYETRMAALIRKNGMLEGQLAAALANREATEKNASSALKSKQEAEKRLADTTKELELLKEKLGGLELAQEEANNLSNIAHSDNIRLEHDVAFLKAVLDDTQKELHSTRKMLTNERTRAFQLQYEVFHLKQRLQSLENRTSTPRKPFQG